MGMKSLRNKTMKIDSEGEWGSGNTVAPARERSVSKQEGYQSRFCLL